MWDEHLLYDHPWSIDKRFFAWWQRICHIDSEPVFARGNPSVMYQLGRFLDYGRMLL